MKIERREERKGKKERKRRRKKGKDTMKVARQSYQGSE
jgi:hypothetical protein